MRTTRYTPILSSLFLLALTPIAAASATGAPIAQVSASALYLGLGLTACVVWAVLWLKHAPWRTQEAAAEPWMQR